MKSKNVGVGDVLTTEEKKKQKENGEKRKIKAATKKAKEENDNLLAITDRPMQNKTSRCLRGYASMEQCLVVLPRYRAKTKCDLCALGGGKI